MTTLGTSYAYITNSKGIGGIADRATPLQAVVDDAVLYMIRSSLNDPRAHNAVAGSTSQMAENSNNRQEELLDDQDLCDLIKMDISD